MNEMIKIDYQSDEQIHQGDIIKDVEYIQKVEHKGGDEYEITFIEFPLVVVLTQECNLELDFKTRKGLIAEYPEDKELFSVLVAPVYPADQVFEGEHLRDLHRQMQIMSSGKQRSRVVDNETSRYHFLKFPPEEKIDDLIVDFKHYFSTDLKKLELLKKDNFAFHIMELYREDISLRFTNYLARIGLPL